MELRAVCGKPIAQVSGSAVTPELPNVGGARAKTAEFPMSCAQPTGKFFLQTSGTDYR